MPTLREIPRRTARTQQAKVNVDEPMLSLEEWILARLAENLTARRHYGGTVDVEANGSGLHELYLRTSSGFERYVGAKKVTDPDSQSGPVVDERAKLDSLRPTRDSSEREATVQSLWAKARDEKATPEDRVTALRNLPPSSEEVPRFVATELMRDNTGDDWRNLLVFVAEDLHFPDDLRRGVGERLLRLADTMRSSTKAGADKVTWAALRRVATLIPGEPALFLGFLDRRGGVDTRSVAIRCIQRASEGYPPPDTLVNKAVADRVAQYATKFLDPDVFGGGENALLAKNAVLALAALGDVRFETTIALAQQLNRRWLTRNIRTGLSEILQVWEAASEGRTLPAIAERIARQIAALA